MLTLRKYIAKVILVVLIANSCSSVQAIDWSNCFGQPLSNEDLVKAVALGSIAPLVCMCFVMGLMISIAPDVPAGSTEREKEILWRRAILDQESTSLTYRLLAGMGRGLLWRSWLR